MKQLAARLERYDYLVAMAWMQAACDAGDTDACAIVAQAPRRAPRGTRMHNRANRDKLPAHLLAGPVDR